MMGRISNVGPPVVMKSLNNAISHINPQIRLNGYRVQVLMLTFLAYVSYHLSRKPISVVKTKLYNCPQNSSVCYSFITQMNNTSEATAKRWEGTLDTSYLFAYAIFMFFSGIIAERVDLRIFLTFGMVGSGLLTIAFGMAYYWKIHDISYFLMVQIIGGALQTTGWPAVVSVVANWFGRGRKGLIFGIWNSHTSIGNILGSLIAGAFVEENWGLSFIVPGCIIGSLGLILFVLLVPRPEQLGLDVNYLNQQREISSRRPRPAGETERRPLLRTSSNESDVSSPPPPTRRDSEIFNNEVIDVMDTENGTTASQSSEVIRNRSPANENEQETEDSMVQNFQYPTTTIIPSRSVHRNEPEPVRNVSRERAISVWSALKIPGVVEFSLCLFFAKLVSYTFLFWLPSFIQQTGQHVTSDNAAYFSTLFDIGGILGGIIAGIVSDYSGKSASTCAVMLIFAIPMLFVYESFGSSCPLDPTHHNHCYTGNIGLLLTVGLLVNGPYALITTAVSAELGTHPSLRGSAKALATVTSIIDGTGSIGAAIGPFLAGAIPNLKDIFYMLMASDVLALLLLARLVKHEVQSSIAVIRNSRNTETPETSGPPERRRRNS